MKSLFFVFALSLASVAFADPELGERKACNVDLSCSEKCQLDKMVKECGMTTVAAQKIIDEKKGTEGSKASSAVSR